MPEPTNNQQIPAQEVLILPTSNGTGENRLNSADPEGKGKTRSLFFWLILWSVTFFLAYFIGPFLPSIPKKISVIVSAGILVALSFGMVIGYSRLVLHKNIYLVLGLVGLILVSIAVKPILTRLQFVENAGRYPGNLILIALGHVCPVAAFSDIAITSRNEIYNPLTDLASDIYPESAFSIFVLCMAQLMLASGVGLWVGSGVDKPGHLIPIAVVAGVADIWSVSAGATAVIIQSSQINYFLLRFPLIGVTPITIPYLIGLTDFLFFGIFFQTAVRFDLGVRKNIMLLWFAFLAAVIGVIIVGVGLPVLPFMAVFFIAGNFSKLSMTSEEIKQMIGFIVFILVGAIIFAKTR